VPLPPEIVPVYAAGEVHGDAVAVCEARVRVPSSCAAAQDREGAVDVRIVHRVGGPLIVARRQIASLTSG